MNRWQILIIFGVIISLMLFVHSNTCYFSGDSLLGFLSVSPTLIGILLASVLTSLAIILAIIGNSELIKIREIEEKKKKNFYKNMSRDMKQDVYFILASFAISSLLSIFCIKDTYIIISLWGDTFFEVYRSLFIIEATLLIISFMATYDIINGLFSIFDFKYELSNQENK